MHNLIGNAINFSVPNKPSHIIIKSEIGYVKSFDNEKLKPKNKYCRITISDNGIGFGFLVKNIVKKYLKYFNACMAFPSGVLIISLYIDIQLAINLNYTDAE